MTLSAPSRRAVVGDAVAEHSAQLGPLLVDGDDVAHEGQVVGCRQAAGASADDGHCLAGRFSGSGGLHGLGVVHGIPLQSADIDGVVHHTPAALALAGVLADIGTGGDKGVVLADQAHRILVPAGVDEGHIHRFRRGERQGIYPDYDQMTCIATFYSHFGAYRNRDYAGPGVKTGPGVTRAMDDICYDPQTSGGLLMALPREAAEECLTELRRAIPQAAVIGSVTDRREYAVYLD